MVTFRKTYHTGLATDIIEVLLEGKVVGALYPTEKGVKIESVHFKSKADDEVAPDPVIDDGRSTFPPIPSVTLEFERRIYYFNDAKLGFL